MSKHSLCYKVLLVVLFSFNLGRSCSGSGSRERLCERRQQSRSRSRHSESSSEAEEPMIDAQSPQADTENVENQSQEAQLCVNDLFGERLYQDTAWAPNVNSEIAVRWEEILLKGIPEENLKTFLKDNPPPENCPRLVAPKINEILKGILPDTAISRDSQIVIRQEKISASIAAIARVLTGIIDDSSISNKKTFIESLLTASKLLSDLHHDESMIRRNLILSNVDKNMQSTLQSTVIDEFLFGMNLEETVKSAKAMQTTGKDLKKGPEKSKNWKRPSRASWKSYGKSDGIVESDQKPSYKKQSFRSSRSHQHSIRPKDSKSSRRQH